ncbi:MAG: hypothetical protein ABIH41_07540 [Nanoarchaeota archaeon]
MKARIAAAALLLALGCGKPQTQEEQYRALLEGTAKGPITMRLPMSDSLHARLGDHPDLSGLVPRIVYQESLDVRNPKMVDDLMWTAGAHMDEESGVDNLWRIAQRDSLEESWAYIPRAKAWIETGMFSVPYILINDSTKAAGSAENEALVKHLMAQNDSLTLYHVHPDFRSKVRDYLSSLLSEKHSANREQILRIGEYQYRAKFIRPSPADLTHMIERDRDFRTMHSDGDIGHAIMSSYGLTTYGLTEKGRERFFTMDTEGIKAACKDEWDTYPSDSLCAVVQQGTEALEVYFNGKSGRDFRYEFQPFGIYSEFVGWPVFSSERKPEEPIADPPSQ